MKVLCAWCGKELKGGDAAKVSHGVCPDCSTKFLATEKDVANLLQNKSPELNLGDKPVEKKFKSRVTSLLKELSRELRIKGESK